MKKFTLLLTLVLTMALLAGCAGTPVVYYTNCTCPAVEGSTAQTPATEAPAPAETLHVPSEGALKTGISIVTNISESASASADAEGQAKYDLTMVAVLVDDNGVIQDCIIDGIASTVKFDAAGAITSDLAAPVATKNELGENYGMVKYANAIAEWDAQAAALAAYAVGKTTGALRSGAIDETGYAPEGTDLASSATIYLGGYVSAIEVAVATAKHLGAQAGDTLKLASINALTGNNAEAEKAGLVQLESTVTALTEKDGVITSCYIDSVQAKVNFDTTGTVTTEVNTVPSTKNQLGEQYGMVKYANAIAEWDAQAASFGAYVTGKTLEEVKGIAVDEGTKPAEADLSASVTIAIGGFQALIEKAFQE